MPFNLAVIIWIIGNVLAIAVPLIHWLWRFTLARSPAAAVVRWHWHQGRRIRGRAWISGRCGGACAGVVPDDLRAANSCRIGRSNTRFLQSRQGPR